MTTIIIPCYKCSSYIERALRSIVSQDTLPDEVLVGIDGCLDSLKVAKKVIPEEIKGITTLRFFTGRFGPYVVRNTLAELSKADLLLFFDADDEMLPAYVSSMVALCEPQHVVRARGEIWLSTRRYKSGGHRGKAQIGIMRDDFLSTKGFLPWPCAADAEYLQRLDLMGYKTRFTSEDIWRYHKRKDSLTMTTTTGMRSLLRKDLHRKKVELRQQKIFPTEMTTTKAHKVIPVA